MAAGETEILHMARKRKNDMAILLGGVVAALVVVVALVVVLVVRGTSSPQDSSGSASQSSSTSETSSHEQSDSQSSSAAGPAGPMIPQVDDEEQDSEESEPEEEEPKEEEPEEQSSSSSSASSSTPSSSSVSVPSSSTAPQSSSSRPVSSSQAAPPASSSVASSRPVQSSQSTVSVQSSRPVQSSIPTTQLDTPEMAVSQDEGILTVTWDLVDHAQGYLLQLFAEDDESDPLEDVSLSEDDDIYVFDTQLEEDEGYKVKIQALGSGSYYDSNRRVKVVTGSGESSREDQLDTPRHLNAYLDEDGILFIEWDEVENASNYTVELLQPNGRLVESNTANGTGYEFDTILDEIGSYKVRVCANPRRLSSYESSEYAVETVKTSSSNVSGDRLAAPDISIRLYNDYLKITWDPVKNATTYRLEIIDPSGKTLHSEILYDSESPYSYYGDINKKGTYQIRMKSINDDGDYYDSPYVTEKLEISNSTLETPGSVSAEGGSRAVTVSFSASEDAQYYQIQISKYNSSWTDTETYRPTGVSGNRGTLSKKISGLSSDTHYRVRVRACTDDEDTENSSWSDYEDFYTD